MTKSSVDRKRSEYGEKYSLRFHKRLKTYDLTCNDETPHLIAKFVETDGDLAMRLFERLESNYKENKQLKQTIDEVRSMDKEKDIEVEHINNIYKEFGFKGIIEYAKDKLQNYGAVREVDTGLWLLATGGWSDNEHWLDCLLDWNFIYGKGHYRATTSGGGYYYSEKPYADVSVFMDNTKGDDE